MTIEPKRRLGKLKKKIKIKIKIKTADKLIGTVVPKRVHKCIACQRKKKKLDLKKKEA